MTHQFLTFQQTPLHQDLTSFIQIHFATDISEEGIGSLEAYQQKIDAAIKTQDRGAVDMLWRGIYDNDRSNPAFGRDLTTSARYGDIDMFLFILWKSCEP